MGSAIGQKSKYSNCRNETVLEGYVNLVHIILQLKKLENWGKNRHFQLKRNARMRVYACDRKRFHDQQNYKRAHVFLLDIFFQQLSNCQ